MSFSNRERPSIDELKAELSAVLSSKYFSRAPTLAKFLSYICERYFVGQTDRIKEYTVAVEAFGRPETFEPKQDPIVRVDANRLRLRLLKYYRNEGRNHPVQLSIPKGGYIPVFEVSESWSGDATRKEVLAAMPGNGLVPKSGEPDEPVGGPSHARTADAGLRMSPRSVSLAPLVPRRVPAWLLSVACLALTVLVLLVLNNRWPGPPASEAQAERMAAPTSLLGQEEELRILAGNDVSEYVDRVGRRWVGDRFFSGGHAFSVHLPVARAEDSTIWEYGREGEFSYHIPLKPGTYELHLYFAEPVYGAEELGGGGETTRLFSLYVNDRHIFKNFDITADAGGARTADMKVLTDISPAPDGFLHLRFVPDKNQALVNAIEILPGIPAHMRPLRITTGETPLLTDGKTLWGADRYYWGGRRSIHPMKIPGTTYPELFATERFGNFNYCIPVAPGRYTARLYFTEVYFGPDNPGGGGKGNRIFDVYCNGLILLKDFDVFDTVGANRAVMKEFGGLRANAQGKLVFTFQPVENYACVNALEIMHEAGETKPTVPERTTD